jgi:hypothetical protein
MIDDNVVDSDRDIQPGAAAHTVAGTDVADEIKRRNGASLLATNCSRRLMMRRPQAGNPY